MDSEIRSRSASKPDTVPGIGTRRGVAFLPLTSHGMPKTPYAPDGGIRSHRFSTFRSSPTVGSPPPTPNAPMSPPVSAKSFGTFIDSAPSTPAYSPPTGSGWDKDIMLLSPVPSAPSSPPEPEWEMLNSPMSKPTKPLPEKVLPPSAIQEIREAALLDAPLSASEKAKGDTDGKQKDKTSQGEAEEQAEVQAESGTEATEEKKPKEEQTTQPASLGKFATKIQSMLRRRSASDKSDKRNVESKANRKRKKYQDLDYMEDVHWSEM